MTLNDVMETFIKTSFAVTLLLGYASLLEADTIRSAIIAQSRNNAEI